MAVPVIELAKALQSAVATASSKTIGRRYTAIFEPKECVEGFWFVIASTEDITQKRFVQSSKFEIQLAYQKALPESSDAFQNPIDNLPFLDACMDEVESIKALFREDGGLNEMSLAGNTFIGIDNDLYRPDFLLDYQIFTSIIKLTFRTGG